MPDYQWAINKGEIITDDYDRAMALSNEQVESELKTALENLFSGISISAVSGEMKEVYRINISQNDRDFVVYACAKGTTPGGRSNLQNEQRIQQKAKYLNYVYEKKRAGEKAACLGIYKHHSDTVFCAWSVTQSTANPETPISKQIKITTIARALSEGFVQQMSGSGDYVCAFRADFIYFYLSNSNWIHTAPLNQLNEHNMSQAEQTEDEENAERVEGGKNALYYGVPGAGKSYAIDGIIDQDYAERVVFHPDYTYSDFVGQILPRIIKTEGQTEGKLQYVFESGPFTRMMKKANGNPGKMHYLVIEEINRGNAPAIFGDIFQLLDRYDNGSGKYHISNYDMATAIYGDEEHIIKIPSNLTILATMNTADQNVFTLDTAFQRRWEMHLIKNERHHQYV